MGACQHNRSDRCALEGEFAIVAEREPEGMRARGVLENNAFRADRGYVDPVELKPHAGRTQEQAVLCWIEFQDRVGWVAKDETETRTTFG